MKPIGPLMREHRIIEMMIDLLEKEIGLIEKRKGIDDGFLEHFEEVIEINSERRE